MLLRVRAMSDVMPEVHLNLGNVYAAQSRIAEARSCFARALSLNPNFALARQRLAALDKADASRADIASARNV
jgi:tetratricopeptide (TPR) repeat protein